ncbi:hypothetical protein [Segatella maculosa]|uniref:hypothetical protein n=1 Tax=Segatella maculosa TaxID=439703 RepID=UPI0012B600DC|nr:hypothetical protein [Segatella maculosa]
MPCCRVQSYPAVKCDRTQLLGMTLPSSWVQPDPAVGYTAIQQLGMAAPCE